jgi:DNA-binding beta-propeller fold protein YncE
MIGRLCPWAVMVVVIGCPDPLVPDNTVFAYPASAAWSDQRPSIAPGPGEGRIFITNNLDDSLSIIDLDAIGSDSLAVLRQAPVGLHAVEREGPHHVVASPDGDVVFVGISNYVPGAGSGPHGIHGSGTADGYALKVRVDDGVVIDQARVDPNPGDIRLTPDGQTLLMTHFDLVKVSQAVIANDPAVAIARLAVIDVATFTRRAMIDLCAAPHGMAISADGRFAYVSCIADELAVVDLNAAPITVTRVPLIDNPGTPQAPVCAPYAVTLSPSGDAAYVSCLQNGQLIRYDIASATIDVAGSFQLSGGALFGTFSGDGRTLVVPHQNTDGITIIDVAAGEVVRVVPLRAPACLLPHVVRFSENEARLLLVCEGDRFGAGTFVVLDAESWQVQRSIAVGRFPDDIAMVRRP